MPISILQVRNAFLLSAILRLVKEWMDDRLPGVAPVAKQQGEHCARAIAATVAGLKCPPFRYRNFGSLATIGRKRAVADFGRIRLSGFVAWVVWCVAHIWFLAGFRNRLLVGANWLWNYLTYERHARLITGETNIT